MAVEDFATIGAFSPVHQFCRIGRYAYVGASTVITQDVPPFSRVVTERSTKSYGVNSIGLERKGFSKERLEALQRAYRLLLRAKMNTSQAVAEMRATLGASEDVAELVRFIEAAERGIVKYLMLVLVGARDSSAANESGWLRDRSKRDSSTSRRGSFGTTRAKERNQSKPVGEWAGMTGSWALWLRWLPRSRESREQIREADGLSDGD